MPEPQEQAGTELFSTFAAHWFDTYVRSNNKPSEQRAKESTLRLHLVPAFGAKPLGSISSETIEHYKAKKLAAGLSAKTVNNQLTVLGKCLHTAVTWGRLSVAPIIQWLKAPRAGFRFLSYDEAHQLVAAPLQPWRDLALFGLRTGLRRGELMALSWQDVDLARRLIAVRHSLVRGVLGSPKSNRERHIPLTSDAYAMLRERQRSSGFVFGEPSGEPFTPRQMDRGMERLCARAGLAAIGWHVLRHTFASHLASKGVPLPAIQQLLGHSSITTTMRYAHLLPSVLHASIALLEPDQPEPRPILGQPVGNAPSTPSWSQVRIPPSPWLNRDEKATSHEVASLNA